MTLVEREPQLAALCAYADEARAGHGRLVLVSGPAGVGKSALIEELHDRLGGRWWWGACDGQFTPRALGPLRDVADQVGGDLQRAVRATAGRDELFSALLEALRTAPRPTPTVLVVEDVHWADEATLDLLRFLGRRIRDLPVLLVVSLRDDALDPGHPLRLVLGDLAGQRATRRVAVPPLTAAGVRRLAEGSVLEPGLLHRLTGGNPFFVREVLRTGSSEVPASVREAVLAHAARVGAGPRGALDIAALIGTRMSPSLLLGALEAAGTQPAELDTLVEAGLLVAGRDEVRFPHELARLAVESAVPPQRRVAGHRAILRALAGDGEPDDARLAFHAEGAGDVEVVLAAAQRAGRASAALGAHREAVVHYERALRHGGRLPDRERAALLDALATELGIVDRWEDSATARQTALELWRRLGEPLREGDDLRRLSTVMWRLCRGEDMVAAGRRAVEVLEPLGPSAELGWAYTSRSADVPDRASADADLARAEAIATDLGLTDLLANVLNNQADLAFRELGDWEGPMTQALALDLRGLPPAVTGGMYANLVTYLVASLRFAEAEAPYAEGLAFCDERDLTTYSTCLRGRRALGLLAAGRWEEAVAVATRVLDSTASPVNLLTSRTAAGLVAARRGEPEATDLLDAALGSADRLGEPTWVTLAGLATGERQWLAGDLAGARATVRHVRDAVGDRDLLEAAQTALWERRLGLPVGAVARLDALPAPYALQLGGHASAAALAWDDLGCPYDAALARLDAGEEADLRLALGSLIDLGARAAADVVRRTMRGQGLRSVRVGARSATRAHPLGLTQRESEVLGLICSGRTNDEIASALVISIRTVDHHVSAVLAKLGVATRREATARARTLGLAPAKSG